MVSCCHIVGRSAFCQVHVYIAHVNAIHGGEIFAASVYWKVFGTLSFLLYFRLPSTFLPSKSRSITTLGTRWHDFFFFFNTLFRYFINLFYSFHYIPFPFLNGCRLRNSRKGTLCPFSVPIHLKKKKKKKKGHHAEPTGILCFPTGEMFETELTE